MKKNYANATTLQVDNLSIQSDRYGGICFEFFLASSQ
jgi:hypothetical protein